MTMVIQEAFISDKERVSIDRVGLLSGGYEDTVSQAEEFKHHLFNYGVGSWTRLCEWTAVQSGHSRDACPGYNIHDCTRWCSGTETKAHGIARLPNLYRLHLLFRLFGFYLDRIIQDLYDLQSAWPLDLTSDNIEGRHYLERPYGQRMQRLVLVIAVDGQVVIHGTVQKVDQRTSRTLHTSMVNSDHLLSTCKLVTS